MSSAAERWVEVYAEKYREESPIFDGTETDAEVAQLALEQVLGLRDEDGAFISKQRREVTEAQARLKEQMGLSKPVEDTSTSLPADATEVERKQAELRDRIVQD